MFVAHHCKHHSQSHRSEQIFPRFVEEKAWYILVYGGFHTRGYPQLSSISGIFPDTIQLWGYPHDYGYLHDYSPVSVQDQKHGRGQEDWPDGTRPADAWLLGLRPGAIRISQNPSDSPKIHQNLSESVRNLVFFREVSTIVPGMRVTTLTATSQASAG